MRDTVVYKLQLDQSVIILNDCIPEYVLLIYNSWFRIKNVQSNRGSELSVGEARRFNHSAYLLSLNSSNHYSIGPDCLKLNKSMSSKRLRHLTCLWTPYTFCRGFVHFAQKYWHWSEFIKRRRCRAMQMKSRTVVFNSRTVKPWHWRKLPWRKLQMRWSS
jgi:hypothetical protein